MAEERGGVAAKEVGGDFDDGAGAHEHGASVADPAVDDRAGRAERGVEDGRPRIAAAGAAEGHLPDAAIGLHDACDAAAVEVRHLQKLLGDVGD